MSKQETTTVAYKCDVCGKSCYPMRRFEHTSGYAPVERVGVSLEFGTFGIACSSMDICGTCAVDAMQDCIAQITSGKLPTEPPKPFTAPMGA